MDQIINQIKEENKGYTMYWKFDYCSNSGWKTKYLFGTIKDIEKYIERYHKDKKFEYENYTTEQVKILNKMFPKIKFTVLK